MVIGAPYLCYLHIFKKELDGSDLFMTLLIALVCWLYLCSMKSVVIDFAGKKITATPFLKVFGERSFRFDEIAKLEYDAFSVTALLKDGQRHKFYDMCLKRNIDFRAELKKLHENAVS